MAYESLFFKMDEGGSGIVDNDEMKRFLAFANLEMDAAARDAALTKADVTGDGKMVRWEARAKHRTKATNACRSRGTQTTTHSVPAVCGVVYERARQGVA